MEIMQSLTKLFFLFFYTTIMLSQHVFPHLYNSLHQYFFLQFELSLICLRLICLLVNLDSQN